MQPTSTTTFDGGGNVVQTRDPDGNVTRSSYDPLSRLVSTIDPTGGLTLNVYTATNLASSTDPRGQTSRGYYDAAGRLRKSVDPSGNYTTYSYDRDGNVLQTTDYSSGGALLSQDTKSYRSMNWVRQDQVSGPGAATATTQYGHDIDGDVILQDDPNGQWEQSIYDGAGQRIDGTISSSGLTVLNEEQDTYDLAGNQYASISMDGTSHTATLDGDDRTTQSVDQTAGGVTTITTVSTYDPDGNPLTRHTDELVSGVDHAQTASASFNAADWRTQSVDNGLTTNYGYDAAGQQRTSTAVTTSANLSWVLDGQGRATSMSENVGGTAYTSTLGYDGNSDLTNLGLPGGVNAAFQYDGDSRLSQLDVSGPTGVTNPLSNHYTYGYDGLSRTTSISSTVSGVTTNQSYGYDALSRLTSDGAANYNYDASGNLQSVTAGSITSTYSYTSTGQPNELTKLAVTGKPTLYYGYDSASTQTPNGTIANSGGDITAISTNGTLSADCQQGQQDTHSTCMGYDAQGRLACTYLPNGTAIQMYYNAAGQRSRFAASQGDQEFSYRGDELARDVVTTYSFHPTVTTVYTGTFLYRQDGTSLRAAAADRQPRWARMAAKGTIGAGRVRAVARGDGLLVTQRYHPR